jgi:hypothetical protein
MLRYVRRIEPLGSLGDDALVALAGPSIQRYLSGSLG